MSVDEAFDQMMMVSPPSSLFVDKERVAVRRLPPSRWTYGDNFSLNDDLTVH